MEMNKIIDSKYLECKLCGYKSKSSIERNRHIKSVHDISIEEYILKNFFDGKYPLCECGCGKQMKPRYLKSDIVWAKFTTNHHPRKAHSIETRQKIKESTATALMQKYGVSNPMLIKSSREKIKCTKKDRYNNENFNNKPKELSTKLDKYGSSSYNNIEQIKRTNIARYNNEYYIASEIGRQTVVDNMNSMYGVSNPMHVHEFKLKMENTKLEKTGYKSEFSDPSFRAKYNQKTSNIERSVALALNATHKFIYHNKEYDMIKNGIIYEIDGDFWHPLELCNLTLSQISTAINDKEKIDIINESPYEIIHIRASEIPECITEQTMMDHSYVPNFSIDYYQKIISKEYFRKYYQTKGHIKLSRHVSLLHKFIRTFKPQFPLPDKTEKKTDILLIPTKTDCRIYNNIFYNNRCSNLGSNFLKSRFSSYWNAKYNGNKSPVEAWQDDSLMRKVIEYRIGCNTTNETFDFSLHQLVRGISARRITTSWFKPVLAAAIYKELLGDKKDPTVFDPCAGYGARLLGFKTMYPDGKYIGIEPNIDTYNELKSLVEELQLTNVTLINSKFEDVEINFGYDIAFTSIPYYDKEIYSNNTEYNSESEWDNLFLRKILSLNNAYINMHPIIAERMNIINSSKYWILNNTSHYIYSASYKKEPIISTNLI